MADEIIQATLLSPDRSGIKGAVSGYTIENFAGRISQAQHTRRLMREDSASIVFLPGAPEIETRYVAHRDIIRLDFNDGDRVELRVNSPTYAIGAAAGTRIAGEGLEGDLKDFIVKRMLDSSGAVDVTFTVLARTPAFYLSLFVDSLPSYFSSGGVSGLSASRQAKLISLSFNGTTVDEALKMITAAIGCEYLIAYDSGTDKYQISLTDRIEIGGTRFVGSDTGGAILDKKAEEIVNGSSYRSRVVPILTDVDGDSGIGPATFAVASTSGATLTLERDVFPSDGWLTGLYVGNDVDGFYQIDDQTGKVITTPTNPVVITQGSVRFATDAAGSPLYYLPPKVAPYGDREAVVRYRGSAFANIFTEAGGDATMSTEGTPNLAAGLVAEGAGTFALIASDQHTRIGEFSQKVICGKNCGVKTIELDPVGDYLSVWVACSVLVGGLFIDVIDANGVIHPIDIDRPFTISKDPDVITIEGLKISDMMSPIRIRVLGTRDANDFLVDGITVVESAYARPWEPIAGPAALFEAVLAELELEGNGTTVEIKSETIDAYLVENMTHDQLVVGGAVRAISDYYDITTRIAEITRDYASGIVVSVKTEQVSDTAIDLLTQVRGVVDHWPHPSPTSAKAPITSVVRADTFDAVELTIRAISAVTGTDLVNYSIYANHALSGGIWSYLGPGAFQLWENQDDAPHVATIQRPYLNQNPRQFVFYVVDNDRNLRSDAITVAIEPVEFSVAIDIDQDTDEGILRVQLRDPLVAIRSLETATRPDPASAFSSWVSQASVIANGYDVGVIGTDTVVFRERRYLLNPKHPELVKIRVGIEMPDGEIVYVLNDVAFDADNIPNVSFTPELQYDSDADFFRLILHWQGDEDTDSIDYNYAGGGFVNTTGRSGELDVSGGFTIDPGNSFTISARGKNNDGTTGDVWSKTLTAPDEAPAVRGERIVGAITAGALIESSQRFTSNVVWSSDDVDVIRWHGAASTAAAFTLWLAGGVSYTITAGNFSPMVSGSNYYIYFDPDVSETTLQISSNITATLGERKLLLCVARKSDSNLAGDTAFYFPAPGTLNSPRLITADEMRANIVRAVSLEALTLSALSAAMGELTVDDRLLMAATGKLEDAGVNWRVNEDGFAVFNRGADLTPENSYSMLARGDLTTILGALYALDDGQIILAAGDPSSLGGSYITEPVLVLATVDTGSSGSGEGQILISSNGAVKLIAGYRIELLGNVVGLDGGASAWFPPAMTTTQRDTLNPPNGALIYNTTAGRLQARRGDGLWGDL